MKDLAKHSVAWVVGLAVMAGLIATLSFSSYFSIKSIEVVRENFDIDSAKIENQLNPFLGKNMVFFQKARIKNVIAKEFPEFAEIGIQKVFPSKIRIRLVSHPVVGNLRAFYVLPPAEEPAPESFTELSKAIEELNQDDASGSLSGLNSPMENKQATKSVFDIEEKEEEPEVATEQRGLVNRVGQAILDQGENLELMTISVRGLTQPVEDRQFVVESGVMDFVMGSIQYLKNALGMDIVSVQYLKEANETHLKTKEGLVLWLSLDRDYREQIDKLKVIYEPAELNKEKLSYIDLRVREKVIYCPSNTSCDRAQK